MNRSLGLCFAGLLILAACADINPPPPDEVLKSPLGKGPLAVGMTKEEVRAVWGEPDRINPKGEDRWGTVNETWIYQGRFPGLPIDVGYASKTQTLNFSGNHLTTFHD